MDRSIRLVDAKTGAYIRNVIRYNSKEGWLERYVGEYPKAEHQPDLSDDLKTVKEFRPFHVLVEKR